MIKLRPAEWADWARLFDWRNDPGTRAASLQQDAVPLDEHLKWLRETLKKASTKIYVARDPMSGSVPAVGMGRLDWLSGGVVELSLTVAPETRGFGYASMIVRALREEAPLAFPKAKSLLARVRETNPKSLRAFAGEGFEVRKVSEGVAEMTREV